MCLAVSSAPSSLPLVHLSSVVSNSTPSCFAKSQLNSLQPVGIITKSDVAQISQSPKKFISGRENAFRKYPRSIIDSLGTRYDYGSVMHYVKKAFSKNGEPTIVVKRPGVCNESHIDFVDTMFISKKLLG